MKAHLSAIAVLIALASPLQAHSAAAENARPAAAAATQPGADDMELPAPVRITRWEDSGLKPQAAQEWASYGFKPHEAVDWLRASFAPVVARTWADKGFDAQEARAWLESERSTTTLMPELDHADPSEWKREGFTPADRLAWWEAGFAFEDALLLARNGMSPANAAWHGHEKLKELRAKNPVKEDARATGAPASDPTAIWQLVAPYVKLAGLAALAFVAVLVGFLVRRRSQMRRKRLAGRHKGPGARQPSRREPEIAAPISEAPAASAPESVPPAQDAPASAASAPDPAAQKRSSRPARRYALLRSETPHCIHCKSTNVRRSRIQPHKFAGINFTEYFRCKHCGKHFAIVSHTPILLVAGTVVLTLTALTAGFLYAVSGK